MNVELVKKLRAVLVGVIVAALPVGAAIAENVPSSEQIQVAQSSKYISPETLIAMLLDDPAVQIIDIRSKKYLQKGVIPRATWITFKEWRGPKTRPGKPPSEQELEALLGENGIDPTKPVVVHNQNGKTIQTGRAAIVYWILKSGGVENIAILNGGFDAWSKQGMATMETHRAPEPTTVDLTMRHDWWADPVEIFGIASGQVKGAILDARLDGQVKKAVKTGKPMMSMPLARYVPASLFMNPLSEKNMSEDGRNTFFSDLRARGIEPGKGPLISVCQTGELSALSWFYASEILGVEDVLYYPDALQGWKSDGGLMFGMAPS